MTRNIGVLTAIAVTGWIGIANIQAKQANDVTGLVVTATGQPIRGATISAVQQGREGARVTSATSAANGTFQLTRNGAGALVATVWADGFASDRIVVPPNVTTFSVTLRKPAKVRGVVISPDGSLARNAEVELSYWESAVKSGRPDGARRLTRTSADGSFEIDGARSGWPVSVQIRINGELVGTADIGPLAAAENRAVTIALEAKRALSVTVRDEFGNPVSGARVALSARSAFSTGKGPDGPPLRAETDANGRVTLSAPAKAGQLVVSAPAFQMKAVRILPAQFGPVPLVVTLARVR